MMSENQIVDIDGWVHVIGGKVICFQPDVYDLNNPEDVKDLLEFAERLYVVPWLKPMYGGQTICYLNKSPDGSIYHGMGDLEVFLTNYSAEIQENIRSAMREGV